MKRIKIGREKVTTDIPQIPNANLNMIIPPNPSPFIDRLPLQEKAADRLKFRAVCSLSGVMKIGKDGAIQFSNEEITGIFWQFLAEMLKGFLHGTVSFPHHGNGLRFNQIKAISQVDNRPQDPGLRLGVLTLGPFQRSLGTSFPKINPASEPVIIIPGFR